MVAMEDGLVVVGLEAGAAVVVAGTFPPWEAAGVGDELPQAAATVATAVVSSSAMIGARRMPVRVLP